MWTTIARAAILSFTLAAGSALAGDLDDFNAAVEKAAAHNRVALGYLRTENRELAAVELERFRIAWSAVVQRFGGKRPDAFADAELYTVTLTDVSTRIVTAKMLLDSGRPASVREGLAGIRHALSKLRRSNGIMVLADCVLDANAAMDALATYDDRALDWGKSENRFGIAAKATIYGHELVRCDRMASDQVRNTPEFRRLIDGANAGLALVPKAIATRDTDLLHRIIIELRSFDNLLAFRFG
jgi:hypothetical protein